MAESCGGSVTVAGSSALLPMTLSASKNLKKSHPELKVFASGQGSVTGLQALQKHSADIAAVDWDASKDFGGIKSTPGVVAYKVAVTPFATVVNPDVKINNLTTAQLQAIFSGKYHNWKEVGGNDLAIVVINRSYGSGTRINYQNKALINAEFMKNGDNYKEVGSSGEMLTNVAGTPGSIGYLDLAYIKGDKVKAIAYNGIVATKQNVENGTYTIWGYGYYLTLGNASGVSKQFIDYVQSSKFQQETLPAMGFLPLNSLSNK